MSHNKAFQELKVKMSVVIKQYDGKMASRGKRLLGLHILSHSLLSQAKAGTQAEIRRQELKDMPRGSSHINDSLCALTSMVFLAFLRSLLINFFQKTKTTCLMVAFSQVG